MDHAHPIKKMAKLGLNQLQRFQVELEQGLGIIDYPVPPNSSMRKTSSRSIRHYYISGIQTVMPIVTCALHQGIALNERIRILDFGCGVARQLLHFTRRYPNPAYYACDVDETSIAFVQKAYPQVEAYVNAFHPPLKYLDASFDLIYSVSIFSHLNREDQKSWLAELARVVKPGGYCFLTTEGMAAMGHLTSTFGMEEAACARKLAEQGILYKEYDFLHDSIKNQNTFKVASLLVGIEGSYGNTVVAPEYIRSEWTNADFEVVQIIEGIIDYRQDLVILRRKR
ncbi:MAG: class I SAM-dependent methyltransferase [Nitrococcus sp.]|nr:class I SAM-dependent methyltransferase [Nitrococcus sp.]